MNLQFYLHQLALSYSFLNTLYTKRMEENEMKTYQMNNGLTIPALGFGTYLSKDGEEVYQAVLISLGGWLSAY